MAVSLRIARVIGPGIKKTASPWRSRIFEAPPRDDSVQIPYAPEALLSLVHVEDVARMLVMLAKTAIKTYATIFAPTLCVLLIRNWRPVCGARHLVFESGAVMPDAK